MNFKSSQTKTLLQFSDITLLQGKVSGSISEGDKIGLVGINGSGKSTLLKVLARLAGPKVHYLPQLDLSYYKNSKRVYEFIAERHEQWWEVIVFYQQNFADNLDESQALDTLSGGELVKLNIAIALAKSPDIILLDEPTNHLDLDSLEILKAILQQTQSAFVLVSHDAGFLDETVTSIWEIEDSKLEVYGGNYEFYSEQKALKRQAQERMLEAKLKQQNKLAAAAQRDQDRANRNINKSNRESPSKDKFAKRYFGNRSQKKTGGNKLQFDKGKEKLDLELAELKKRERKSIKLKLEDTREKGLLISIADGELALSPERVLDSGIDLSIYYGDRLAILGKNGSGKTTLANQLIYNSHPLLHGEVKYGRAYRTLKVDQKYELVKPELNLVENLSVANENISYGQAREILARLGFSSEKQVLSPAGNLSGGETARLAFAIATSSSADLLILDEPTNNLDLQTVEDITNSLNEYNGTIIAISHNKKFLEDIDVEQYYELSSEN